MITRLSPFLAFCGNAREAIEHYRSVFPEAALVRLVTYGPKEEAPEGNVRLAVLRLGETDLRIIDVPKDPNFRPSGAVSVFLECATAEEVDIHAEALSQGGFALMPADAYGFADRYAWISDRFGIHWQLIFGEHEGGVEP